MTQNQIVNLVALLVSSPHAFDIAESFTPEIKDAIQNAFEASLGKGRDAGRQERDVVRSFFTDARFGFKVTDAIIDLAFAMQD